MMCKFQRMALFILCLTSHITFAGIGSQQQIELKHPDITEPLIFNINLPSGYSQNHDKSYVMVFDFHSLANTYLSGMHDWMSHNGEWPWLKSIIVTPAAGNPVGLLFDKTGKDLALLEFFEKQLLPAIDAKYRTNGFKIISGFRDNATIVLSALLNKPHMFSAYIAASPELKDDYAGILSSTKSQLTSLKNMHKFLLFTHGTNIKEEHQLSAYRQLKVLLETNAPDSLDWHYRDFSQHYFMSIPVRSVIDGIELVFDDINNGLMPTSTISQNGVAAIVKHYEKLSSKKYGFHVSPKASITKLGFYLLAKEPKSAIAVFNKLQKKYPDDAYSFHNLARAYSQIGDYGNAVKYQTDAVKLSQKMLMWHQKRHKRFLQQYQAQAEALNGSKGIESKSTD